MRLHAEYGGGAYRQAPLLLVHHILPDEHPPPMAPDTLTLLGLMVAYDSDSRLQRFSRIVPAMALSMAQVSITRKTDRKLVCIAFWGRHYSRSVLFVSGARYSAGVPAWRISAQQYSPSDPAREGSSFLEPPKQYEPQGEEMCLSSEKKSTSFTAPAWWNTFQPTTSDPTDLFCRRAMLCRSEA